MKNSRRLGWARAIGAASLFACLGIITAPAQQLENASVIQHIDAAIQARFERVAAFTVTEHYAVFRKSPNTHPVATMTVKTVYRKDTGKSYTILAQTGSQIVQDLVLKTLLKNEERINQPGNREASWFTSANYEMKLKSSETQRLNGRECLLLAITPKRKAPNLIVGTIWVDAKDFSIVQIQGTSSEKPSVFTGPAELFRQYANFSGFVQATHASAVSDSPLFGRTIVTIDYQDYQVQLLPNR